MQYNACVVFGIRFEPAFEACFTASLNAAVADGRLTHRNAHRYDINATGDTFIYIDNMSTPTQTVLSIQGMCVEGPVYDNASECWINCEPAEMVFLEKSYSESVAVLSQIYTQTQPACGCTTSAQLDVGWMCIVTETKN